MAEVVEVIMAPAHVKALKAVAEHVVALFPLICFCLLNPDVNRIRYLFLS